MRQLFSNKFSDQQRFGNLTEKENLKKIRFPRKQRFGNLKGKEFF